MNSPYKGKFKVTQEFKGTTHDGMDLVGIDSKVIHSTVDGMVSYAGWENKYNQSQGFGMYVSIIKDGTNQKYYFGHLSKILVHEGQHVSRGQQIGIEGSTGHSTGSHVHYCCRLDGDRSKCQDISKIIGIPNALGTYSQAGAIQSTAFAWSYDFNDLIQETQKVLVDKGYGIDMDGIAGPNTYSALKNFTIEEGDRGPLTRCVQNLLNDKGFKCGVDGIAGPETMKAISQFQKANGLGEGYLGGEDWYHLIK